MQINPEDTFARKLELLQQLRVTDCLSTVVLVATRLAHDIGTPLAVIAGRSGMIARGDLVGDGAIRSATIIAEQAERISAVLRQLLDVARWHTGAPQLQSVAEVVEEACGMLAPIAAHGGLTLHVHSADTGGAALVARANAECVMQLVTHLMAHAMTRARPSSEVNIEIDAIDIRASADPRLPGGQHARVTVSHVPAQQAAEYSLRNFDLFTAAQAGGYIGLAICDAVVRAQGGRVSCERIADGRANCAFHLPAQPT